LGQLGLNGYRHGEERGARVTAPEVSGVGKRYDAQHGKGRITWTEEKRRGRKKEGEGKLGGGRVVISNPRRR